jgi:sodium-dependent dicarboxylate transporter 2/3/5
MDQQAARSNTSQPYRWQEARNDWRRPAVTAVILIGLCGGMLAMPTPEGLSVTGQRVLAVAAVAIGLWSTDALPMGLTSMLVVVMLVLLGGVPTLREALTGFAHPVAYFLMGVLTIGLAVLKSGLAERVARVFLQRSGGRPRALYVQMLLTFPFHY